MPSATYTPLGNITTTALQSSVTISGFSAVLYRDLVIIGYAPPGPGNNPQFQFNADVGGNYAYQGNRGTGAANSVYNAVSSQTAIVLTNDNVNVIQNFRIDLLDFAATNKHKSVLTKCHSTGIATGYGRWASTAAVTSVRLFWGGGSWPIGTKVSVYGIAA